MIEINIRDIQHFMYCQHRWGLIKIEKTWAENYFVTKSNIFHDNVHSQKMYLNQKKQKVYTAVTIFNDNPDYYLYGVLDCLEVKELKAGKEFNIIEYKPCKPQNMDYREDDLMQVFAQKICIDHMFNCDCDAYIYYNDVKRRYKLPLRENYQQYDYELKNTLKIMRHNTKYGVVPEVQKSQNCNGCSMKDICLPSANKNKSIRKEILKLSKEG